MNRGTTKIEVHPCETTKGVYMTPVVRRVPGLLILDRIEWPLYKGKRYSVTHEPSGSVVVVGAARAETNDLSRAIRMFNALIPITDWTQPADVLRRKRRKLHLHVERAIRRGKA